MYADAAFAFHPWANITDAESGGLGPAPEPPKPPDPCFTQEDGVSGAWAQEEAVKC